MILCALNTSRSREQNAKIGSHRKSMRKVCLFIVTITRSYHQTWQTFFRNSRSAQRFVGFFFWIVLFGWWLAGLANSYHVVKTRLHLPVLVDEPQRLLSVCPPQAVSRWPPSGAVKPNERNLSCSTLLVSLLCRARNQVWPSLGAAVQKYPQELVLRCEHTTRNTRNNEKVPKSKIMLKRFHIDSSSKHTRHLLLLHLSIHATYFFLI